MLEKKIYFCMSLQSSANQLICIIHMQHMQQVNRDVIGYKEQSLAKCTCNTKPTG